ncbi:MAG: DNA polymerase IV [Nitrospirota bacterium]|nr:DNA polymerase IV [Nitrospirota bacterium]
MDAFFASVEQQANPRLRGKPIAVTGSGHRTVITTRSYEARKFGVKTGMNIYEAKKLCPHLILVIGDNEKYAHTCKELSKIYAGFTPDVETYSIDEAFLDITNTHHLFGGVEATGTAIKKTVQERFGINCTVGIAPNILMAKLASDLAKPDGMRWIKEEDIRPVLKDMPVKELWGIGPATEQKLAALGIRTCGELGDAPAGLLRNRFGIVGETLKLMGQGICLRTLLVREEEARSIGHSMTLPEDIWRESDIDAYILKLSEMVGRRARRHCLTGDVISVVIRYRSFETFSRQSKIRTSTNDTHAIHSSAMKIIRGLKLSDRIRLLGVSLSGLRGSENPAQLQLLKECAKKGELLRAMDNINDRYGEHTISWAGYMPYSSRPAVISPAWRPDGVHRTKV